MLENKQKYAVLTSVMQRNGRPLIFTVRLARLSTSGTAAVGGPTEERWRDKISSKKIE